MFYITLGLIFWVVCGVLGYGISLAHWQRNFPITANDPDRGPGKYREDVGFSIFIGFCGPLGLLLIFFLTSKAKHGLKFK